MTRRAKHAAPIGAVKLSARALNVVRRFMARSRQLGQDDGVAALIWVDEARSKGPNNSEWREHPAGLTLGSYSARELPPDVVDTIDRMKFMFSASDPSIFPGKTIDYQNGRFILVTAPQ